MQTTAVQPMNIKASTPTTRPGWFGFFVGLGLTAVVPAVFWVGLFAGLAKLFGYQPSLKALLISGMLIVAFLGTFFAILSSKPTT